MHLHHYNEGTPQVAGEYDRVTPQEYAANQAFSGTEAGLAVEALVLYGRSPSEQPLHNLSVLPQAPTTHEVPIVDPHHRHAA